MNSTACQAHDMKNLFVVDGSCFVTFPEKNPTLTIMALAVRTARYMAGEIRKKISSRLLKTPLRGRTGAWPAPLRHTPCAPTSAGGLCQHPAS